ncbi:unnamed protein product [Rotaria socialis]|uniref:Photosynthesis system II assembly factor Ycf48/Hcf136-like domain-containing protein n=1 Tax=Rotaria socialis TaxID=392032 RepID=A0A818XW59_9BILA|nr:unnamed protein product [Rotaria socialis]CAF4892269.1 unnamed protein product [Rotaria socialis]
MTIHFIWIQNSSTRGSNVLIEKGDGRQARVRNGETDGVNWEVPRWTSGQRLIVNNNGPRIWFVDRDNALLVSTDEGNSWHHYMAIRGGDRYGMMIRDDGVAFQKL